MIILITLTIMIITITITLTIMIVIIIRWMLDEEGWLIGVNFHGKVQKSWSHLDIFMFGIFWPLPDGAVVASYPWDHYTVDD